MKQFQKYVVLWATQGVSQLGSTMTGFALILWTYTQQHSAISFLCGDLLMAVGRNGLAWAVAGIAASLPIPFIMAGNNVILYKKVPSEVQGRVFAVRNCVQFSTIPVGILLGGWLADYVCEPFMQSGGRAAERLSLLVGTGSGSGMALMFLCTGAVGFIVSCISYGNKQIRALDRERQS